LGEYEVDGSRPRSRPEGLEIGCAKRLSSTYTNREDAMDHRKWRKLIKDG